jgi:hypothetical protein
VASILEQIGTKVGQELKALTPADSHAETTFNTDGILVSSTIWSSPSKTSKIGSKVLTYTNGNLTSIVEKDGSDVTTLTKTIAYDGDGNVSSITKEYA